MNRLQVHGKMKLLINLINLMNLCVEDLFHEQPKQYWRPVNYYHTPGTYSTNTGFGVNQSNGTVLSPKLVRFHLNKPDLPLAYLME